MPGLVGQDCLRSRLKSPQNVGDFAVSWSAVGVAAVAGEDLERPSLVGAAKK